MLLILHAVHCKMAKLNIKPFLKKNLKNCNRASIELGNSVRNVFFSPQKMISRMLKITLFELGSLVPFLKATR